MAAPHPTTHAQQHDTPPRPALYERTPCATCGGAGAQRARYQAYCKACRASWTPTRFDALMECYDRGVSLFGWRLFRRNRYRWQRLPCGHDATLLRFRHAPCSTCDGAGYFYHEAPLSVIYRAVGASVPGLASMTSAAHRVPGVPTTPPMTTF